MFKVTNKFKVETVKISSNKATVRAGEKAKGRQWTGT
jgi:hypothetical protein